jgi:dCMP deaminase
MLMVSVGIRRVVAKRRYHAAHDTRQLFAEAGVELAVAEDVVEGYEHQ